MPASDDERDRLGEELWPKIKDILGKGEQAHLAGKITGMMLDSLEASEIQAVMDDKSVLREKVEQAVSVLNGNGKENGNGHSKQDTNGNSNKQLLKKMDEIERERKALQAELQDAEKWADEMQAEWDQKEKSWKNEKESLMHRVTAAEGRIKVADKESDNGADKVRSIMEKVEAAEKRLKAAEADKAEIEKKAERLQKELSEAQAKVRKDETNGMQEKVKELEKALAKAKDDSKGSGTLESTVSRLKAEVAAKEDALADERHQKKAALEELQAKMSRESAEHIEVMKKKVAEAEARAETEKARADQIAARADDEDRRGKADKCRQLQQDLETAHREIKSYKGQLKGMMSDSKAPNKGADKRLTEAQKEIEDLKKKLRSAGVSVPDTPKKADTPKAKPPAVEVPAPPASSPPILPAIDPEAEDDDEVEEAEQEDEEAEVEAEAEPVSAAKPSNSSAKAVPDAKSKAHQTAAGKSPKKKGSAATPVSPATPAKKRKSNFQLSGTHVVAGCLAVIVMIQLGLFVYEGWFVEQKTWAQ